MIFDCDGVLVDSWPTTHRYFHENLERHGLTISREKASSLLAAGTFGQAGELARGMGADLPSNWLEDTYQELYAILDREVQPIPGVASVLDALDDAGILYAVGSNGRVEKMRITLRRVGLLPRFENRLYSAQDVRAPKPSPDVYLKIAGEFSVPRSDCVVIEDTATGAKAASAAEIRCLGYVANSAPEALAPYTEALFRDMNELAGILGLKN